MSGIVLIAYWAWMAFIASWWLSALWVAPAAKTAPPGKSLAYLAGFAAAFLCLFTWRPGTAGFAPPEAVRGAALVAELGGFALAWWARAHLGRLWSGMLTLREGHRVIDTGPYALARHPIYTGFILAAWAFALASGSWLHVLGAVLLTAVMAVKARDEERWLTQELGAAEYDSYRARTRMLVPLPRRDLRR